MAFAAGGRKRGGKHQPARCRTGLKPGGISGWSTATLVDVQRADEDSELIAAGNADQRGAGPSQHVKRECGRRRDRDRGANQSTAAGAVAARQVEISSCWAHPACTSEEAFRMNLTHLGAPVSTRSAACEGCCPAVWRDGHPVVGDVDLPSVDAELFTVTMCFNPLPAPSRAGA